VWSYCRTGEAPLGVVVPPGRFHWVVVLPGLVRAPLGVVVLPGLVRAPLVVVLPGLVRAPLGVVVPPTGEAPLGVTAGTGEGSTVVVLRDCKTLEP